MEEKIYLAGLHYIGINQKKLHILFEKQENYKLFYEELSSRILFNYGFTDKQINFILEKKRKLNIEIIKRKLQDRKVKIVTIFDKEYPDLLKQTSNPPFLFYLRGKIDNSPKIAVIGSRSMTSYGKSVIEKIIPDLSKYFVIISGGASGCDTQGHLTALNNGNKTISVIGTGIDIDYPTGNKKLYDKIVKTGGGIISIFSIGEVGNPYNFPIRNEIVAGLSIGVYVIEAKARSGTLITSNLALDGGKDLFVTPGGIFNINSEGCNNLIRDGSAKPVICSKDILDEYNITSLTNTIKTKIFACKIEEKIYNLLLLESYSIDELIKKINIDIKNLIFKLSMMEINGLIKKGLGGKYEVN